ncbi:Disease resistance protein ADR2 [Cardamine amara subsp. amara]|uniref:Disease resistance protein ADR2 n=1 Tax=Cardamine amara subsp. amara TaxID=228776 RepID=A0ABD0ZV36_CARAN
MAGSSSPQVKNFDVFPSFHGPDVRRGFLSHLHSLFARKSITMFKDQEIERGHTIGSELVQAIRGAKVSVVLLSKNYASSGWCLDELVEILKCKEYLGQIVMPIFYDVDPSHVRKQKGDFGIAFQKTCESESEGKKWRWKEALTEVATIAGEHSHNWINEAAMVEQLATAVSKKLIDAEIKKEFRDMDKDQNGFLSAAEVRRHGLTDDGEKLTDDEVEMFIRAADADGDGLISYDEFIKFSRAIRTDEAASEEEIKMAFRLFDKDRNGLISAAELRLVMKNLGEKVTDEEVEMRIREVDVDGDGQINYDEFVRVMTL